MDTTALTHTTITSCTYVQWHATRLAEHAQKYKHASITVNSRPIKKLWQYSTGILNASSESVVSCFGSTTVHWVCSTVVTKVAAIAQLPVSSICTCVYFTQYSAEMHRLRTYVNMDDRGVSRLDRIRMQIRREDWIRRRVWIMWDMAA